MPARVLYITDPACPYSWGIEPQIRRLLTEFGDSLAWTFVMGGLARSYDGVGTLENYFEAAVAVGGQRTADSGGLSVRDALRRFDRMAAEFEVKPTRAGTGWLWALDM